MEVVARTDADENESMELPFCNAIVAEGEVSVEVVT